MRSLGRNKQFRAGVRMQHELRKAMEKLHKQAASTETSTAKTITQRLDSFLGRARQMFTRPATS